LLAAFVAIARAGGPAAYDIGTVSADHNSIGYSQESTQKGYAGQNVVSSYSSAEDSAHSSVRVSNSRVSNDALLEQHAIGYGYAAPALAKPLIAKTAYAAAPALAAYSAHPGPVLAKAAYAAAPAYGYAAAPAYGYAAAPAYGYAAAPAYGYAAAPAYGYAAAAAPILAAKTAYAAPAAYNYASPLLAKTYASPLLAKTYAAPAPLIAKTAAYTTYAAPATPLIAKAAYAAAPILAKTAIAAAPALAYTAHAAPVIAKTYAAPYSYEAAAPVVHATFSGFGTSYAW